MPMFDNKVVVVTGGSSGIGRAAALSFASQGAKVVVTGRRATALEEMAAAHPNIAVLVADVAKPKDAARTIGKAIDTWGRLDVLVNNAGAGALLPLRDTTAERMAGIFAVNVIGPSLLGWVAPSELISILAEIGVIFLLFTVGLETKPQSILQVGMRATVVAVLGVALPFVAGYFFAVWWDGSFAEAMFVGAAPVATSVGITARVLGSIGLLDTHSARIILGAAVIDDILGLIILSLVASVSQGTVSYVGLAKTAAAAVVTVEVHTFAGLLPRANDKKGRLAWQRESDA